MKLYILMGQRKESYLGEYGPEALKCATEHDLDENPGYLETEQQTYRDSGYFESVQIITLKVFNHEIMSILRPANNVIDATVVKE